MYSSMTLRRNSAKRGDWVQTFMPASAKVVQEAG